MPDSPTILRILVPLLPPGPRVNPPPRAEAPVAQLPVLLDPWARSLSFFLGLFFFSLSTVHGVTAVGRSPIVVSDSSVKGNDSPSENNVSLCTSNGVAVNSAYCGSVRSFDTDIPVSGQEAWQGL